jgi:hypothetical protein
MRLVGGAVRACTGNVLVKHMDILKGYTDEVYSLHSEKSVRKAANKLVKVSIFYCITLNI